MIVPPEVSSFVFAAAKAPLACEKAPLAYKPAELAVVLATLSIAEPPDNVFAKSYAEFACKNAALAVSCEYKSELAEAKAALA